MSLASVRAFLTEHAPDLVILDGHASTATVADAAAALGVEPARIAKTLSLRIGAQVALLVTRGDARLDNRKARTALGAKPRMLGADEVADLTGHPVGGVCPFGAGDAAADLRRRLAAGLRDGVPRGGIADRLGGDRARAVGGDRGGDVGGCVRAAGGGAAPGRMILSLGGR